MSAAPRVTIGLPVYNGERYLSAAIDSILGQTFGDFELIVSDNASTDGTAEICRSVASQDRRVRYHRRPVNVGMTRNFNELVGEARAPFFKWQSADDLNAPDLLHRCIEVLDRDPSVVLVHAKNRYIGAEGEPISQHDPGLHLVEEDPRERLASLWRNLRFCNAQFGVMRTSALRHTPLFGSFIGSDITLLEELCLHGKFVELPDDLLYRRFHGEAASSMTPEQLLGHYGLPEGALVLYNWRHLGENARLTLRAPLDMRPRLRVLGLVAMRVIWQRRLLGEELGLLARHLVGLPHPVMIDMSPGSRSSGG